MSWAGTAGGGNELGEFAKEQECIVWSRVGGDMVGSRAGEAGVWVSGSLLQEAKESKD